MRMSPHGAGLWHLSEFELQFYFQTNALRKNINPFILSAMCWIVPLLFFYKDVFGSE